MPVKEPVRALPAAPPAISLFTSAEILSENDTRWEAGVKYESEACGIGIGSFAACNVSGVSVTPGSSTVELEPIILWAGDSCSSLGYAARDWQGRARRKLASCESKLLEIELWRGNITRAEGWTNPYLAHADTEIVTGAATSPLNALACLEQSLSDCNCGMRGMIHATPELVTNWLSLNLIYRDGARLLTHLGTVVVPGAGYDGSGPPAVVDDDPVPASSGSVWAYATSMVHLRLGPIVPLPGDISQAMNRSTNTLTYWAQRVAIAGWDCCTFAAEIDIPTCATGS